MTATNAGILCQMGSGPPPLLKRASWSRAKKNITPAPNSTKRWCGLRSLGQSTICSRLARAESGSLHATRAMSVITRYMCVLSAKHRICKYTLFFGNGNPHSPNWSLEKTLGKFFFFILIILGIFA